MMMKTVMFPPENVHIMEKHKENKKLPWFTKSEKNKITSVVLQYTLKVFASYVCVCVRACGVCVGCVCGGCVCVHTYILSGFAYFT